MTTFLIPLLNVPQRFEIALGGKDYIFTSRFNAAADAGWCIDLEDAQTNEPIAFNIPMITGANLLDGLEYLGIPGELVISTDGDELAVPTLENLGVESFLYYQAEV